MATKIQYAKIALHQRGEDLVAVITTDSGHTTEKVLTKPRYERPGWRLDKALRFAFSKGWRIASGGLYWYMHEGLETRSLEREVELCPNGQGPDECSEIDPCESCWQDEQDEGDMIEESMGLGNTCHGCTGTCCTGVGSDPCTC